LTLKPHSHPLSSYCWKVLIALYENGAPFEALMVDLGNPEARAAYAAVWPTAKIPLLEDGDRIVPETSIQIEYLDTLYPGKTTLLPVQTDGRLRVRLWDRLFDNYVMDPMGAFVAQLLRPEADRDASAMDKSRADLLVAYRMIDERVGERTWAAGPSFSMADCAAAPSLFYASMVQPFPEEHTHLSAYFERLMARPSVQRVIAEARPFFQYFPLRDAMPARFLSDAA
jgi:glutathione S-transferase